MNRKQFEAQQAEADSFGGSLVAAKYWQGLRKSGFAVAVESMASVSHWETILPAMDIPEKVKAAFMESMFLPAEKPPVDINLNPEVCESWIEKAKVRRKKTRTLSACRVAAIGGLLATRNLREKSVIATARRLSAAFGGVSRMNAAYDGSPPRIVPDGLLNTAKAYLTFYLLECIEDGDWKSLEALAKIIKRRDKPEDARGGELSYEGQTWTAFCLLHWNHRTLPTKAEIRESMALTEDNKGEFSKWVNRLGLGGLPEK